MHLFDLGTKIYRKRDFAGNSAHHTVLGGIYNYVSLWALFMP